MHDAEVDAPVAARKLPAAQPTHTVAPVTVWYWPTAHPLHCVELDAPVVVIYIPAAQPSQKVAPDTVWY